MGKVSKEHFSRNSTAFSSLPRRSDVRSRGEVAIRTVSRILPKWVIKVSWQVMDVAHCGCPQPKLLFLLVLKIRSMAQVADQAIQE